MSQLSYERPIWALLRCSTDRQDLEHQRGAVRAWLDARKLTAAKWLEAQGVSRDARVRIDINEAIEAANAGKLKTLVVWDISRLGSSLSRIASTMDQLRSADAVLVSVKDGIDTSTPMGRAMSGLATIFAQYELEGIRERTKAKLDHVRKHGSRSGLPIGRPGYEWTDEDCSQLLAMREEGMTWADIRSGGQLKVFRATITEVDGERVADRVAAVPSVPVLRDKWRELVSV